MQLNGFDEFILKIPGAKTNTFVKEDCENNNIWGILLPILSTVFWPVGLILALVMYSQKKAESDYIKFLANQSIWICIGTVIPVISIIGLLFAILSVYGNVTGKYFDLPLVGSVQIIKY
ncbi:MAG: hypothetical protein IJW70_04890 [Clostridia bacterium]|nr:hypothetical protein [Clostridia bacterium]